MVVGGRGPGVGSIEEDTLMGDLHVHGKKMQFPYELAMLYDPGGPRWGSLCRMSSLTNGNGTCLCRLFSTMSHVEFRKWTCRMSLSFFYSHGARGALIGGGDSHVAFRF